MCSGAWLFFEKFLIPGTWLFLNFCFFSRTRNGCQIRRKEETKKEIYASIIIAQSVSRLVHTKHNNNVTRAPLKKGGRKSPEERRARQTRDTYLFIRVIRRAKKKHARAQSSNDIDEADLFFVVIGRTNEQKKVRQSTNTRRDDDDDFLCALGESF